MNDYLNTYKLLKLKRILKQVNHYKEEFAQLTDEALQSKTNYFKHLLQEGYTLDAILPEAYAVVREASKRILGMFPYDVQVLGAIVLHQGNIAEMKTGEGKTLTATMPAYLNALTGKGVIVVTTNAYLAIRDCQELSELYRFLGLTVSVGVHSNPKYKYKVSEKQEIYNADIVYTTNSGLGFDYLIHNLADSKKKMFLKPFNYAIIDEIDSVLLDSAQMPLIISGYPRVQSNLYQITNKFVAILDENEDYKIDEEKENVWLTQKGIQKAESFFSIDGLYQTKYLELVRHISLALKAHTLMTKEKQYIVEDNKVKLLDSKLGRVLEGTKLQAGQHQALEAKEQVKLTPDKRAMASITYQNLFRQFKKISGMTGTGRVEEDEFIDIYNMEVQSIPTNKPTIRKDFPDKIYRTTSEKLYASFEYVKKIHEKGQPLLIVTESVGVSEIYSKLLLNAGIPHNVLNARNAAREAQIISEAGQMHSVTVATAMAGRGTDIKLGEGVAELGGLVVVGTECMSSKRSELQVRGRSGRQGDPGHSQFFISLEDEVIGKWGPEWIKKTYQNRQATRHGNYTELKGRKYRQVVDQAQESNRGYGKMVRQNALDFDDSITVQRKRIYEQREKLLDETSEWSVDIYYIAQQAFERFVLQNNVLSKEIVLRYIYDTLDYNFKMFANELDFTDPVQVLELLNRLFRQVMERKEKELDNPERFNLFRRNAILKAMDECWIEQVDYLQQLRMSVISQNVAQRNPLYEYRKEAFEAYNDMKYDMYDTIVRYLSLSSLLLENGKWTMFFA